MVIAALLDRRSDALCPPHQLQLLEPNRSCDREVFGHIDPPFLGLVLRHEGLPPADARGQFDLCDTGATYDFGRR